MKDLITRLEQATEGSRELDCDIFNIDSRYEITDDERRNTYNGNGLYGRNVHNDMRVEVPHYTESLDKALTLVPEGVRGWQICKSVLGPTVAEFVHDDRDDPGGDWYSVDGISGEASTPALALCIAALKALLTLRVKRSDPAGSARK